MARSKKAETTEEVAEVKLNKDGLIPGQLVDEETIKKLKLQWAAKAAENGKEEK